MDDDSEDLKARIQELEDELQKLKDQKKQEYRDSADVDQEIEEVHDQIRDEAENSGMSRRKFMKTLAGGGAALGAAAMMPSAAALDIESNNPLSYNSNFEVSSQGNLNLSSIKAEKFNEINYVNEDFVNSFSDIGAAINDVVSSSSDSEITKIVVVGEYEISTTIDPQLGNNIQLDLSNAKLTIADGANINAIGPQNQTSRVKNWIIRGGEIDCNRDGQTSLGSGVKIGNRDGPIADNIIIRNLYVHNSRNSGVTVSGDHSWIVECLTEETGAHGSAAFAGESCGIVRCTDRDGINVGFRNWRIAFDIEEATGGIIEGCSVINGPDSPKSQAFSVGRTNRCTIRDCRVNGLGGPTNEGGNVIHGQNNTELIVKNVKATGINGDLVDGLAGTDGLTMRNVESDSGNTDLRDVTNINLSGCYFPDSVKFRAVTRDLEDIRIENCELRNTLNFNDDGYNIDRVRVSDTEIYCESGNAIAYKGNQPDTYTRHQFNNVTIDLQNDGWGFAADNGMPVDSEVKDSTFIGTEGTSYGLVTRSAGGDRLKISNCVFCDWGKSAIEVSTGSNVCIRDTDIHNYAVDGGGDRFASGIVIRNDSPRITGCKITGGNGNPAMYEEAPGAIVRDNDLSEGLKINSGDAYIQENQGIVGISTPPSSPSEGDRYMDDSSNTSSGTPSIRVYDGTSWVNQ